MSDSRIRPLNTHLTAEQIMQALTKGLVSVSESDFNSALTLKANTSALESEAQTRAQNDETLQNAIALKASSSDLSDEQLARIAADAALQTAINGCVPFGVGTLLTDDLSDPDNPVYADLFQLPVGKYMRINDASLVLNRPSDMTSAFYCEVNKTIADNRRIIRLYPTTQARITEYYVCLETATGYGEWYRYCDHLGLLRLPRTLADDLSDPDNPVYADLFQLPIGIYLRTTGIANVQNLPPGWPSNGSFIAYVGAGATSTRTWIRLIQIGGTGANGSEEYRALKSVSSGGQYYYGPWYKFSGTEVVANA